MRSTASHLARRPLPLALTPSPTAPTRNVTNSAGRRATLHPIRHPTSLTPLSSGPTCINVHYPSLFLLPRLYMFAASHGALFPQWHSHCPSKQLQHISHPLLRLSSDMACKFLPLLLVCRCLNRGLSRRVLLLLLGRLLLLLGRSNHAATTRHSRRAGRRGLCEG